MNGKVQKGHKAKKPDKMNTYLKNSTEMVDNTPTLKVMSELTSYDNALSEIWDKKSTIRN